MYQRDYSGIKSDGQLYEYERSFERNGESPEAPGMQESPEPPERPSQPASEECKSSPKTRGGIFDIRSRLRSLCTDDIILIAIGLLLLTDGEDGNDILLPLILLILLL